LIALIFVALVGIVRAEPLRISVTRMPVSAPVFVAREHGLFKQAGLDVEFREYELGKTSLKDLSAGKLDVAFAAVTPIVHKCMAGDDFKILATVASSTGLVALAARKDFGIQKISDIQGKRIGLIRGTSGEFFFETLRVLNRIPTDGMKIVPCTLEGMEDGLRNGSLDVVSTWEPQIQELRMSLTNRLALFYGDGLYTFSWNMTALASTIARRRAELEKFVDVLFQAADLIEADPEQVATELVTKLGQQGRELSIGLKEVRYRPQLGQELLVQLEGETRWIINRDQRTNAAPNFLRWLDTSILKKDHPSAVTVIQ
jgi:NitT/TauT family transport system substrate-binding protein